jgi:hypothetical protein
MKGFFKAQLHLAIVIALIGVVGLAAPLQAGNWWESIKVKGDLRYRHEMLKNEDKDARHRHRVRARVGVFAKANDMMDVGVQMATGSADPVSTNQTLDGAFSTKGFGLDMAYFAFHCEKVPGLKLTAGKFKNPFFKAGKSELIWDSDWNPEGGVVSFNRSKDNIDFTVLGAGLWIDERSSSDDSYLAAVQGLARFNFNEKKSSVVAGGGFFNYVNTQGFTPFYDASDPMGNSATEVEIDGDTILVYTNDYELLELFGEFTHKFDNIPVTVMADFVTNTAADSLETGWLVGFRAGKAKKVGSWEFRYIYREVEKDAVVGIFTDSDFRGGGTNAKGHEFGGAYQLAKNAAFKLSYFINEIGLDLNETENFQRLQADLQLKF